jgi:hypothetical protein
MSAIKGNPQLDFRDQNPIINKYYIPNLEEFHVGFRYEFLSDPCIYGTWRKVTCTKDKVIHHLLETEPSSFRVKFLDRDDIEELGWDFESDDSFIQTYFITCGGNIYQLTKSDKSIKIINKGLIKENNVTLFFGQLKNYNKLKDIMDIVGINSK